MWHQIPSIDWSRVSIAKKSRIFDWRTFLWKGRSRSKGSTGLSLTNAEQVSYKRCNVMYCIYVLYINRTENDVHYLQYYPPALVLNHQVPILSTLITRRQIHSSSQS